MDWGSLSLTATGLIIFSISKGPMNLGLVSWIPPIEEGLGWTAILSG